MNTLRAKANPEFKRTQPLPVLTGDSAPHAGWAARSFAQMLPRTDAWPVVAARVAGAVVNPGLTLAIRSAAG